MNSQTYWQQQSLDKPLFPNLAWSRPEQRSQAGRLGIIGGNSAGFQIVAKNYDHALRSGVGEVKILLPDSLKKSLPPTMTEVVFAKTNPSGGLSKEALPDLLAFTNWSQAILMIGENGQNSETAILYENFITTYQGPLVVTRDAVDLLKDSFESLLNRPQTVLVVSFAQLQKLFQKTYYPIILTFSMQLTSLVSALYKFTITYPVTIMVLHQDKLLVAHQGQVTSTPFKDHLSIWQGYTTTKATVYWLWHLQQPLESLTTSLVAS